MYLLQSFTIIVYNSPIITKLVAIVAMVHQKNRTRYTKKRKIKKLQKYITQYRNTTSLNIFERVYPHFYNNKTGQPKCSYYIVLLLI